MAHKIVVGLGFGDEGKGSMVDYLTRQTQKPLVVRFNGGAQAGHNVVTPEGQHHTFSQFGSGTFAGAPTLLSKYVVVDPIALIDESKILTPKIGRNPLQSLHIDSDCIVTTPFHVSINRIKEWLRGKSSHGSCGKGFGETVEDLVERPDHVIRISDLNHPKIVRSKLEAIQEHKRSFIVNNSITRFGNLQYDAAILFNKNQPRIIANAYKVISKHLQIGKYFQMLQTHDLIFEGAQGALLDENYGFTPHTTWSTTTPKNAQTIMEEVGDKAEVVGVTRTYFTRHGNGPFPSETSNFYHKKEHNRHGQWQGAFRYGYFDDALSKYVSTYVKPDNIAVTHVDVLPTIQVAYYDMPREPNRTEKLMVTKPQNIRQFSQAEFMNYITQIHAPVGYVSRGPTYLHKTMSL